MKMITLIAVFAWIIVSCGDAYNPYVTYIDAKLKPELTIWQEDCKLFMEHAKCNTYGIESITISDKLGSEDTIGQCEIRYKGLNKIKRIYIREDVPLNTYYSRALILHEMLHCRFDFMHHTDNGLMAPSMYMPSGYMADNWPELLEETYALVK